ncbi:hypothetical protein KXR53_34850, partial [Inquilinus limosus]|uniref:hypothetical protein n=1 Tax=Inquilinus limosus TaxID=171674 RepID=UPI003F1572F2
MTEVPPDLDIQAYCRGLALQQVEMLTRLAEIGMQLAEGAGARALAAQTAQAEPKADEAEAQPARTEDPGLDFARYAHLVRQTLAQRARAARDLCADDKARTAAREAGRPARRDRHRDEVEQVLKCMIWDEVEDLDRCEALS